MSTRGEHIVLIGTMGAGKSTVGAALAAVLERPYVDNDEALTERAGATPAALLATKGRAALHELELETFRATAGSARPSVLSAAASLVETDEGRALLAAAGQVLYLHASEEVLASHLVAHDPTRPLPTAEEESVHELDARRAPLYAAVADATVEVRAVPVAETVRTALRALQQVVRVELGERSYDVVVGPGARLLLSEYLPPRARQAAVVTQEAVGVEVEPGLPAFRAVLEPGEHAKSLASIEDLCRHFSRAGLTRADVVIGVGGGVVTDVAGFAAAVYHRGVAVLHVPTTLLGQVDAAIGGKTGVNLPEGKNLVGAFWQPAAVLCDTDVLSSLPEREWRSGRGEMAKYAFIGVEDLDELSLVEQVRACVACKAAVVAADEREGDARMILNYGHTLAHALEAAGFAEREGDSDLDLRHGEAVAIGLVFAGRLAQILGRIDEARVARHLEVVRKYGLPEAIPEGADHDLLLELMGRDKKATEGITFVLDGPKGVEPVRGVPEEAIRRALVACSTPSKVANR